MTLPNDNRSVRELFTDLSRETSLLIRQEIELATIEMTGKVRRIGTRLGMAAVGGALLYAGLLVLLAAVVAGLTSLGLAAWLSALIVAVITLLVGIVMLDRGLSGLRSTSLAPHQTIDTIKETTRWTRNTPA